jgi:hypothetical protein
MRHQDNFLFDSLIHSENVRNLNVKHHAALGAEFWTILIETYQTLTQSCHIICSIKQHKSNILYYVTPEAYWFRNRCLGGIEVWEHQTYIVFTDKNVWKRELFGQVPYTIGWRNRIVTEMTPNSNPTLPSVLESVMCKRYLMRVNNACNYRSVCLWNTRVKLKIS